MATMQGTATTPSRRLRAVVDRQHRSPFPLRVFVLKDMHSRVDEYANFGKPRAAAHNEDCTELRIYTWLDSSLSELAEMVHEVDMRVRKPGTRLSFMHICRDPLKGGRTMLQPVGVFHASGQDDTLTLSEFDWRAGDMLEIAILS
jgi:hypothetical protein